MAVITRAFGPLFTRSVTLHHTLGPPSKNIPTSTSSKPHTAARNKNIYLEDEEIPGAVGIIKSFPKYEG
eukprot:641834-Amphidinium_carterae.1